MEGLEGTGTEAIHSVLSLKTLQLNRCTGIWCHFGGRRKTVQCPLHYGRTFPLGKTVDYKSKKLPKGGRLREEQSRINSIHFVTNQDNQN